MNGPMTAGRSPYEPGQFVCHPGEPAWGVGQVQSVVGHRITVNFEGAGKVLVNTAIVTLDIVDTPFPDAS